MGFSLLSTKYTHMHAERICYQTLPISTEFQTELMIVDTVSFIRLSFSDTQSCFIPFSSAVTENRFSPQTLVLTYG